MADYKALVINDCKLCSEDAILMNLNDDQHWVRVRRASKCKRKPRCQTSITADPIKAINEWNALMQQVLMQQVYKAVRITYKEKYKKGAMMLRTLPEFTHTNGAKVISVELTEVGCLDNGHEYQILRLELEPRR